MEYSAANGGSRNNHHNDHEVIDLVSSSDNDDDGDGDDRMDEVRVNDDDDVDAELVMPSSSISSSAAASAATTTTNLSTSRRSTSFVIHKKKLTLGRDNSDSCSHDGSDTDAFLYEPPTFRSCSGLATKNTSHGIAANSFTTTNQKKPSLERRNISSNSGGQILKLRGETSGLFSDYTNSTTTDRKLQQLQQSTKLPMVTPSSRGQKLKLKQMKEQETNGRSSTEQSKPSVKRSLFQDHTKKRAKKKRRKSVKHSSENSQKEESTTPSIADEVESKKKKKREMYMRGPLKRGYEAFEDRQSKKWSSRPTKNELNWCILKVLKELPEPEDKLGIVRTDLSDLVHGYCGVHIVQQHPMGGQPKFEHCNMEELEEKHGHGFVTRDRKRLNTDKKHNRFLITEHGRAAFVIVSGQKVESEQAKKGKITAYFQQKKETSPSASK